MKGLRSFNSHLGLSDFKRFFMPSFLLDYDWVEDNSKFSIDYDMPGLEKSDIKVNCENGMLYVKGEKEIKENLNISKKQYNFRIYLPDNIDSSKIEAIYTNGVLSVSGPKKEDFSSLDSQIVVK